MIDPKTLKKPPKTKPLTQAEKFRHLREQNEALALLVSEFELVIML
jgi:hypothetical protein